VALTRSEPSRRHNAPVGAARARPIFPLWAIVWLVLGRARAIAVAQRGEQYYARAPACCAGTPLVFRWNGSRWSRLSTKLGNGSYLSGVAITSAGTAWAVGSPVAMITGALAKWNGTAWSWVKDPVAGSYHPLNGIAAGPGGTVFMVGTNNNTPGPPVSARWNGSAWKTVSVSAPSSSGLNAVAFAPGGSAWAAGVARSGGGVQTLMMRWNGKAWTRITSPAGGGELYGLAFSASNYGWAVGTTISSKTVILHWNGSAWS